MRAEYVWEEVYKAALVETDECKLPNRIQAAKVAIDNGLYELRWTMVVHPKNVKLSAMR